MLEIIAAILLVLMCAFAIVILAASFMVLLGVAKGVDLEHLHDDDLE